MCPNSTRNTLECQDFDTPYRVVRKCLTGPRLAKFLDIYSGAVSHGPELLENYNGPLRYEPEFFENYNGMLGFRHPL